VAAFQEELQHPRPAKTLQEGLFLFLLHNQKLHKHVNIFMYKIKSYFSSPSFKLCYLQEEDELISEWTPEPLVPTTLENHRALHPRIVSSKVRQLLSFL